MEKSFNFKSFIHFLKQNKLYTGINLFGFSVSLMFVILIAAYTAHELSADRFHAKRDRIFRLENERHAGTGYPVGRDLKARYPEIENYTFVNASEGTVGLSDQKYRVKINYVDSSFFQIFSIDLIEGDPSRVLEVRGNAAINERFARKLFGDESPVGREIELDGKKLTVTGVYRDFRHGTLINSDVVASIHQLGSWFDRLGTCNWPLYLLAAENTDLPSKRDDMLDFFKDYYWIYKDGVVKDLILQPMTETYFYPKSNQNSGDKKFIWTFCSIGILILIFAVINYVNLSVAQTGFRAKEMAVRRLLGSSRGRLFANIVTESVLLCAVSLLVGLGLAFLCEGLFNRMLASSVNLADYATVVNGAGALLFIVILGIVAGAAPAAVITNYKPVEVVKGAFLRKTKMVYGKILIVFQYFITIVLIGCTIVMMRQIDHMIHIETGFDKDCLINIENTCMNTEQAKTLRGELMKVGGVAHVALACGCPGGSSNNNTDTSDPERVMSYQVFLGDSSYFDAVGFGVLRDNHNKSPEAMWLNETALAQLGLKEDAPSFKLYGKERPIAGIVRDFRYWDLTRPMGATLVGPIGDGSPWNLVVRLEAGTDQRRAFDEIRRVTEEVNHGEPFVGGFIDEAIQNWYDRQQRMARVIGSLALIAVVISTLGILAMATYYIRQRSKEIAIRKVYGSTNAEVLRMLIGNFMRLVLVGFVVAVPVIVYAMRQWLETYTSRISLGWTIFAVAGLFAGLVAFLTVYWQSRRAAHANPVDSVKK